jgi:uncharacterized protein (TIGR03118 family)
MSMFGALAGVGGLMATATSAVPAAAATGSYRQTNLVSDIPGVARITDPHLVNPWGMSEPPGGPLWVSNNNDNTTTLYTNDPKLGTLTPFPQSPAPAPLVVKIGGGAPTGQVFNGSNDFVISAGGKSGPARFIFASENGDITGWSPTVPPIGPDGVSVAARHGTDVANAVYKGLAMGHNSHGNVLYAANFMKGQVDEFDGRFHPVKNPGFVDPKIPAGYAPFNIYVPNPADPASPVYVTYAKQNAAKHDDVKGAGHGFIDVFKQDGTSGMRLVSHGPLDSPWGMVIAPAGFGTFGGDLLVGNFGNGMINAFNPATGVLAGNMVNPDGNPIAINGLWGLIFGDAMAADANTLIFSAGIADEAHGLLGTLSAA